MSNQGQSAGGPPKRAGPIQRKTAPPSSVKKPVPVENGSNGTARNSMSPETHLASGERTVRRLRLSRALTIPEDTMVAEACRRMFTRKVDAALLTDSSSVLCGIVTDKDIATRVIAEGLKPDTTPVSKIMTKNPTYVMMDTSAVEALQKMVQGKFRHLPVVENAEVKALLDITKCLYDAIAKMEKAAEKGSAIAAAVEGVERQYGDVPSTFIETLRDQMFRPTLSTLITDNRKIATVSPFESVYLATKKMREFKVSSVVITNGNKPKGILTSKDVLTRVVAQNLSPESTLVDKVMTRNPECANVDTTIVDALHIMHDGKFLHLPVVDRDGFIVACIDVLQITHAAISTVGGASGAGNDIEGTMLQKFLDSTLSLELSREDEEDNRSDISTRLPADGPEPGKMGYPFPSYGNSFAFKFQDFKGRVHRFNCGTESLTELASAVVQRLGDGIGQSQLPQILYEDDEGDKVLLTTDSDLSDAVNHARLAGLKVLRLHIENVKLDVKEIVEPIESVRLDLVQKHHSSSAYTAVITGAAILAAVSITVYLKRSAS
uniref:TSA: Wollemia nobilis Ref_Wollemi_Transcript_10002_2251 transcribed RNA sequence n=1 Tax=Wollemia nobilis TaxID=56998 RepID=A0A0C9S8Z5_9CONI